MRLVTIDHGSHCPALQNLEKHPLGLLRRIRSELIAEELAASAEHAQRLTTIAHIARAGA